MRFCGKDESDTRINNRCLEFSFWPKKAGNSLSLLEWMIKASDLFLVFLESKMW